MNVLKNTPAFRDTIHAVLADIPFPSDNANRPAAMLMRCPAAGETPLSASVDLADELGLAAVYLKDERDRMGLGSFKALGAAYVIACDAEQGRAKGTSYFCASAGNHGLSVAAGAQAFGAHAVIYLSKTVPEAFAVRLESFGAEVRRRGETYEQSMQAAAQDADAEGAVLLSDSSWPGYLDRPHRLMEGYLVLMQEAVAQMTEVPTHIFLQAGVGGLACAAATYARKAWGTGPEIIVVEPEAAPALKASMEAGQPLITAGPVSAMGRLDCKEPSLIALKGLARDADMFMTITEEEGQAGADLAERFGLASTNSGAAGLAGLVAMAPHLDADARVLLVLSEGPE